MAELLGPSKELDERVVAKAALDAAEEQLQSLCASHAGTFVSVERRARAVDQALVDLSAAIKTAQSKVGTTLQALEQDEENENSLSVLSEKHRVRRRTLLQHASLLELLEIPSAMDACVRSSLYEEALSIAAFANTLERRHADNNAVVSRVIAQIRSRQADLRRHLLARLQTNVTMPQCLEVVTALRRLNSIDLERQSNVNLERVHDAMEQRLQIEFLEARDVWLDATSTRSSMVNAGGSASEQLLDTIERYRTRVFEVATQFNAIFRAHHQRTSAISISLLSMWTARRVSCFLTILAVQLASTTDSAALRDALEASIFFASSMGRLGADFTAQLPPIFETRMHELVVRPWKEGAAQLGETLKVCREALVASPLVSRHAADTADTSSVADLSGPQPPPRQLLALPPLARLANAILMGLNELRRCLLPGIMSQLRTSLDELLQQVSADLEAHERAVLTPGLRGEAALLRETAAKYQTVLREIVDPYVRGSLEAALGNDQAAIRYHATVRENEKEAEPEEVEEEEVQGAAMPSEEEASPPATIDEPQAAPVVPPAAAHSFPIPPPRLEKKD